MMPNKGWLDVNMKLLSPGLVHFMNQACFVSTCLYVNKYGHSLQIRSSNSFLLQWNAISLICVLHSMLVYIMAWKRRDKSKSKKTKWKHFADDVLLWIFSVESFTFWCKFPYGFSLGTLLMISQHFLLVQVMAWPCTRSKSLSEPLLTKMCLTIWNIVGPVNIINHSSMEAKKDCKTTLTSTVIKVSFAQSYQNIHHLW